MASEDRDPDATTLAVRRLEVRGERSAWSLDEIAREEPLEIRLAGVPLAVVMRTPGHDEELTRGFLVTERVVDHRDAIVSVRHCTRVEHPEAEGNVVQVVLADHVVLDLQRLRRNLYASSSCGICGKATLDNVLACAPPLAVEHPLSADWLRTLPTRMRRAQAVFDQTGGLHAAALFELDGEPWVVREDVGRHNAVDKVIGWTTTHAVDLERAVLCVSGRTSYEIVQKALAARISVVVAVSAPSSLAVELAMRGGITLLGFVRDDRMCVYANAQRLGASDDASPGDRSTRQH